jgi:predicted metal-dependent hydrolase
LKIHIALIFMSMGIAYLNERLAFVNAYKDPHHVYHVVAHELAHLLELNHVFENDDPECPKYMGNSDNLMYYDRIENNQLQCYQWEILRKSPYVK